MSFTRRELLLSTGLTAGAGLLLTACNGAEPGSAQVRGQAKYPYLGKAGLA